MLTVSMLGGMSFSIDGSVVRSDLGQAGRLLACYLFEFSGRVHRRERLADLFWRDTDPDKARSALNTAIWRIRKVLELGSRGAGQHLISIGDDVMLEPSQSVRIDTHQLESAFQRVLNATSKSFTDEEALTAYSAVDEYKGPFLDGHDAEWILQERERMHCIFVRATFALMQDAAMRGQLERALDFGRRILAVDPLRESVQRDVMHLLVLNGQRVEAIRMYKRLVVLLKSELDIAPMPETERLNNDIVSGKIFEQACHLASVQFNLSQI
jgi:DNA-binding SARP family transcriptional activator